MAAHELVDVVAQELLGGTPDVAVAGAVGAVLADVQLVDHVARQGIAVRALGDGVVEGGVGHDDVALVGEQLAADLDGVGLGVVVQRRQRSDLADPAQRLVGDDLGLGEVPATLNDAVADADEVLARGVDDVDDVLHGGLVVGQRGLDLLLALDGDGLVAHEGAVDADALAVALGVDLARCRRRAAGT